MGSSGGWLLDRPEPLSTAVGLCSSLPALLPLRRDSNWLGQNTAQPAAYAAGAPANSSSLGVQEGPSSPAQVFLADSRVPTPIEPVAGMHIIPLNMVGCGCCGWVDLKVLLTCVLLSGASLGLLPELSVASNG